MGKPFQISIRRTLAATALFGIVIGLLKIAFRRPDFREALVPGEALINGWDLVARMFALAGAVFCFIAGVGAITETKAKLIRALAVLAIVLFGVCCFFAYHELQ